MSTYETCPFCGTGINLGATVCTGCGAYKAQRSHASPFGALFVLGFWLMFGPGMFIAAFMFEGYFFSGDLPGWADRLAAIVIGVFVTFLGWYLVRRLFQPVWFRRH